MEIYFVPLIISICTIGVILLVVIVRCCLEKGFCKLKSNDYTDSDTESFIDDDELGLYNKIIKLDTQ